ncbi:matrixin family metalloprotease [Ferruginibacter sp. HRS2-29]|uniref:matrixin family metalloprotease n=1 Tax=Ferruginibacter sp. HRS2-29 TaxID=2487334 RepID=UPI0020CB825B|nr:matrixin family metalloprotease [Ferruginibacter sp. HRS2-29]MCP9753084.1 Zn-dependent protease [Ferruginibacter sp. HRS2-29]
MKKQSRLFYLLVINYLLLFCGCKNSPKFLPDNSSVAKNPITIEIQPFEDISKEEVKQVFDRVKKVYPVVQLNKKIPLPATAWYPKRQRYRADSIIQFLNRRTAENHVSIGLTTKDISTTKGNIEDWGVMGLGFRPGKACVASTFRVSKTKQGDQLFKVSIHELGHTQGLPHCPVKHCFMRNAEGGNPTDEETGFCNDCKNFLIKRGCTLQEPVL